MKWQRVVNLAHLVLHQFNTIYGYPWTWMVDFGRWSSIVGRSWLRRKFLRTVDHFFLLGDGSKHFVGHIPIPIWSQSGCQEMHFALCGAALSLFPNFFFLTGYQVGPIQAVRGPAPQAVCEGAHGQAAWLGLQPLQPLQPLKQWRSHPTHPVFREAKMNKQ